MVQLEHIIHVNRPPSEVWRVMTDVERWPEWTATVRHIVRRSGSGFAVGSAYRISQPSLLPATWRVTRIDEDRAFDWETRPLPGARIVGSHSVEADATGTRVTLAVRSEGPLAPLLSPAFVPMSRRNLPIEAEGLKRRCEAGARSE
jgi:uncharacterized membrane protein